jgi:signal peptidase I
MKLLFTGILLGILLKFFAFEVFTVPTDSMTPTIAVGSKVVLSKLILRGVKRGDVVGFERNQEYFVKRITGVPNDRVQFTNGQYELSASGNFTIPQKGDTIQLTSENYDFYAPIIQYTEGVLVGKILDKIFVNNLESTTYTFKQDYFFMEGDNKQSSIDSRNFGIVGQKSIKGWVIF